MKKLFLLIVTIALAFTGCKGKDNTTTTTDGGNDASDNKIVFGVSPVPHAEITEALQEEFKKEGLEVEVKVFDDYVQPNLALDQGDIDANFYQHLPYLENFCKERNIDLVSIGKVHIEPIGIYSDKIKSLDELKDGDSVLIPSDPTNGRRALLLLEKAGLITLTDNTKEDLTEKDIKDNPKNLDFSAADPANVANLYKDVTIAAINTNFALGAGLNPSKDALILEDKDSPYANIIAVKKGNENKEKFQKLIKVFNSEACKKFIEENYNGEIYPAF
ncbi:MAG: MetQ/NlpA family ABC transporter substrate-binding protein [Ezakiella sp.]|uniref:MetQ/NlpA family ABC transporter substrate-binding protein n=1 Tax=Ezakiella sp. TaxID=1935205 RepID=UPI002978333B|nr:MetQ/NlpA family ABC transporter substrate-binding protein [Ezakiella sp.]MDD7731698.1 MetQ/NlpA family ABC transporter substrate-binding protein [Eubacteriales bacterium]MDY6080149.1 MetQ/NlpA family ABC transporter substrate-binding protein [Ezakiella sp.]